MIREGTSGPGCDARENPPPDRGGFEGEGIVREVKSRRVRILFDGH